MWELAKVVRRTMPWLRIVFLSGHDEFEYAQKAVSLHADAYLLKPVSSAQLLETLGQVAEQIEQEQQQLRSAGANSRSEREEDVLREHFLNDLLSGSVPTAEAAVQGERWGLLLTAKQYLVCIVRLPENAVQEQVRALTERLCGEESEVCAFFRGSRRLVLLLRGDLRFLWILHQAQCVMVQITVNRFIHFREPFYTAYHIVTSLRYESFITVFNLPVIIINPI